MGYRTRGFLFSGRWSAEPDVVRTWLGDDLVWRAMLAPIEPGGYLARADQIALNLDDYVPIGGLAALRARSATWRYDVVSLIAGGVDDPDWELHLGLDPGGPRVFVGIAAEQVTAQLREDVAGWVFAWCGALGAERLWLSHGRFEPLSEDYPHAMPRRESPIWQLGSLDQYDGIAWHRTSPERSAVIDRLLGAALPANARRIVNGDVVRIAFDCDLASPASIADARAAHERWLAPLVPTAPLHS